MATQDLVEQDERVDRGEAPGRAVATAGPRSRVVHVIGTLDRGGAETLALDVCRAVPAAKIHQTFLTLGGRDGRLADHFRAAGAAVEQCALYPRATFTVRLFRVLRRLRPDVVVSHVDLASGFILMVARLAGIPGRVSRLHTEADPGPSRFGRRVQQLLMRRALWLFATDVVGVTQASLGKASGSAKAPTDRRFRVLPNGVNLSRLDDVDRATARQALGLPLDAPVLVHIGRASPEKNRRFVGDIFRSARARSPNVRLVVVGPGGAEDLGDVVSDPSIMLAGERDDIGLILAAADVLLLPSLREGLPGAVLEALACGVPVVATNLGGLREVRPRLDGLVLLELAAGPTRWAERALQLAEGGSERREEIRGRFRASPFLLERTVAQWVHLFRRRATVPPPTLPVAPAVALGLLLALPGLLTPQTYAGQAALMFGVLATGLAMLARRSAQGVYGGPVLYLLLLGLFHCGLVFKAALQGEASLGIVQRIWLRAGYTPAAVRLAVIGMLAFLLASAVAARLFRPRPSLLPVPRKSPIPGSDRHGYGLIGIASQLLGIATVLNVVQHAGGLDALVQGYTAFLSRVDGSRLGFGILFYSLGTVLGLVGGGRWREYSWLLLGLVALGGIPLGTRGVVMFPLAAMIAVEARRGRRMRPLVAVGVVLGLLMLISVVRASRQGGFSALLDASWAVSPLDAVAEMGSSLRPTVVVLAWHSRGEPFRHGITYVAVPLRLIERWTGWHGGPPAVDERMFQVEVMRRAGPIGGSPVAEAFHNFGSLGVVALLAIVGVVVGALDARPSAPLIDALAGVVLLPLFTQVRNAAATLLPQIAIGLALVVVAGVAQRAIEAAGLPSARRRMAAVEGR